MIQTPLMGSDSWLYNPVLVVELVELGATLIALSIPGCKSLLDQCMLGKKGNSSSNPPAPVSESKSSKGPVHRENADLQDVQAPRHNMLGYDSPASSTRLSIPDGRSIGSSEGILTHADRKEEAGSGWNNRR